MSIVELGYDPLKCSADVGIGAGIQIGRGQCCCCMKYQQLTHSRTIGVVLVQQCFHLIGDVENFALAMSLDFEPMHDPEFYAISKAAELERILSWCGRVERQCRRLKPALVVIKGSKAALQRRSTHTIHGYSKGGTGLIARLHLAIAVMLLRKAAKPFGSVFGRNVALWSGKQFVAHHELSHRCRAQQRRAKVRMQVPFGMMGSVRGLLVETHGVRERGFEEIVVAGCDALQHVSQRRSVRVVEGGHV